MNIFACDENPQVAASWLADQHVVKMTIETAQILSTALFLGNKGVPGIYKPTHIHHPCVIKAVESPGYFQWSLSHGISLAKEYTLRYDKIHASSKVLFIIQDHYLSPYEYTDVDWAYAMPEEYKQPNAHESYINYLQRKYHNWALRGKKQPLDGVELLKEIHLSRMYIGRAYVIFYVFDFTEISYR